MSIKLTWLGHATWLINHGEHRIMQLKIKIVTLIALAWLAGFSSNAYSQSNSPQWKLKQGDQFSVILTQTSNSLTKVDAREITVDNKTIIELDWNVTKVAANGDATIQQALTRVKLSVNGFARVKKGERATPLKDIEFDTADPDDATKDSKTLLNQIQPLLGLKFSVVMAPDGEIKNVTVPKAVTALLNGMPDARNLQQLFSAKGWKDVIGASAIVLPSDLRQGKSWTDEADVSTAMGQLQRVRTYTYSGASKEDGISIGEFDLVVELNAVAADKTADVHRSKLIEFSGTGKLLMDLDGGFLKSSRVENRTTTEKPYREKTIATTVTNEIETIVMKK